jgi:hypothetical protein
MEEFHRMAVYDPGRFESESGDLFFIFIILHQTEEIRILCPGSQA